MSAHASGMSHSATGIRSTNQGENLQLIDCPRCCIPVVKLRSKRAETFNWVFYKCPNNFQNDDTCSYFWWHADYVKFLRVKQQKQNYVGGEQQYVDWTEVSTRQEWRQDFKKLSLEIFEVKQQIVELKQQFFLGKNIILLALVVGVLIGILVCVILK
ncbi:hypothetical protein GUJ93_ZPchr0013g35060 [Zizania palustris]|uniref:Zinc finger GRF-type domain-containing protein n=1 Tax=Zizania palustris TaxID=103762 RepID=A0A8J5X5H7_ZIZPA|nr:hypothetical protein GUJ93_ZPchr0013g35060 [Zizania palustris]